MDLTDIVEDLVHLFLFLTIESNHLLFVDDPDSAFKVSDNFLIGYFSGLISLLF